MIEWKEGLSAWIGKCVYDRRKLDHLSQTELADRAGKEKGWVSRIERGVIHHTVESVGEIAATFGIKAWQLVKEAEERMEKEMTSIVDKTKIISNGN